MSITSRSSSRNGQRIVWIALHTTEGGGTARQLRDADWWVGSSHAIADNTELLTPAEGCVPYDRGSWTLRNGNARSVNIEQIGYAKWTRDYWLSAQMPMLRNTARWVADVSKRFGVPLTYIGTDGVRAGRAGVIQHNDYSKGTGDGSHWDCGPGYPIDVVMDMARGAQSGGDDELSAQFESNMTEWTRMRDARDQQLETDLRADLAWKGEQITVLSAAVAGLAEAVGSSSGMSTEEITAAVRAGIPERLTYVLDE